jgi:hypothetical protein
VKRIEVPGMGLVEFPDDMGDDQIENAIKRNLSMEKVGQTAQPRPIGSAGFGDFLRDELQNADWGTRNIAAFGTGLSDLYERGKQLIGRGDRQAIEANKIMQDEAPVGGALGKLAVAAAPFALAGNSVKAAAAIGGGLGFAEPVAGEQSLSNIAAGTAINTGAGAALSAVGQVAANKAGDWLSRKVADIALRKAQNAPLQRTVNAALDEGLVIPPSSVNPSLVNTARESIAGKIATAQEFSNRNQDKFADIIRREVGLAPDEPVTAEAMKAIRARAFSEGYEPVGSSGRVIASDDYRAALDKIVAKYRGAASDFPGAADDSVLRFVEGTKKTKIPGTEKWVDDAGREVGEFVEPKAPKLRSLLAELKQNGGISTGELGDIGEQFVHKNYPGLLRKKGGNTADGFTEWMISNGWLAEDAARMADDSMPGGAHELARDMIRSALNREPIVHPSQYDRWAAYVSEGQRLARSGIQKVKTPDMETGGLRVASFDAGNGLQMTQILRNEATEAYRQGNNALAKAKREAAKAIEDEIERHLARSGDKETATKMLEGFRAARKLMAKTHDVDKSIVPGSGTPDVRKFAKLAKDGKLSGGLETIGNFVANFPRASQPAAQVAGPGISALRGAAGPLLGAGGAMAGAPLPVAAAVAAYPFLVPPLVRRQMMSRASQNALRDIYKLGLAPRVAGGLLQNAPIAGAVLGPNALAQYLALEP